ncbi:MAG TPA: carbohydrate binding domain-containing protein [candidate division Zixibacteria bacterium]|nr:carbohydrate binding domain-containing protein [candidate division Zixibacteria bacterium]
MTKRTINPLILIGGALIGLSVMLLLTGRDLWASQGCTMLYNPGNGWAVETCPSDPEITIPMDIFLDGAFQGEGAYVRVYHQSQDHTGSPQVAVLYASGFVRLKQNANPEPPIPFGSSFVLGPGYWSDDASYHHSPQLSRLDIDTSWLPNGPLRMHAVGRNQAFSLSYDLTLPPPRDRQTRLHVTQTYTATTAVTIPEQRRIEAQGFKLAQISSMFISEDGVCDGDHTECHDGNAVRFIGQDLARHQRAFKDIPPATLFYTSSVSLGSTWLDALHTNDESWQGNTPNVRISLDFLPDEHAVSPQGWINPSSDPNDDNVGLWLNDNGLASQSWLVGQSDTVSYWLIAQDDPLEPWVDLGLRAGQTFLDFESVYDCFFVHDGDQGTSGAVRTIAGYSDTSLEMAYDLGDSDGNWVQLRCNFNPPLDLSDADHLRFDWRGDPQAANSLEIGLVNPGDDQEHIFGHQFQYATHRYWWSQMVMPFGFLHPWTEGTQFDPNHVSAFFISVVKEHEDDVGGAGQIAIDNLNAYSVISRTIPADFEVVTVNEKAADAAASWLVAQQQPTGLLKSWQEDSDNIAYTYDQALALLVFSREAMWNQADNVVAGLSQAQNGDGSWFSSYDAGDSLLPCIHCEKWEGANSWVLYALNRYLESGGTQPAATTMRSKTAEWLASRIDPATGCLDIDHTEGTIDAWWAMQAAGPAFVEQEEGLKKCLLTHYWDEEMGRFKGGQEWRQPYLDNQTWGAAFLKAVGEDEKALRALSYAREVLLLPTQGAQLYGFDGQAGPWSVWNEGTAQYAAAGGHEANDLVSELLAQQRVDGSIPGSPDYFDGGGVWTPRWHGVAPTAWFYNALSGEPFHRSLNHALYLPAIQS